jgi:hypothetical protein
MSQIHESKDKTHFEQEIKELTLMNMADSQLITMTNNMTKTILDKKVRQEFRKVITDSRVRLLKRIKKINEYREHTLISDFYGVYCSKCGLTVRKN